MRMRTGIVVAAIVASAGAAVAAPVVGESFAFFPDLGHSANDRFGSEVVLTEDVMIVTSAAEALGAGVVNIFDRGTGAQLSRILASPSQSNLMLGAALAVSGDLLAIGEPNRTVSGVGTGVGRVVLYDISDPASPMLLSTMLASDGEAGDAFGSALSFSDSGLLAIGAIGEGGSSGDPGAVYLFDVSDPSMPTEVSRLDPSVEGAREFGEELLFDGSTLFVGVPAHTLFFSGGGSLPGAGRVYVYDASVAGSPVELTSFRGSGSSFGSGLAVEGDTMLIGARSTSFGSGSIAGAGAAILFDISDPAQPLQGQVFFSPEPSIGGAFGTSVSLSNGIAVVGSERGDAMGLSDSGAVEAFEVFGFDDVRHYADITPSDLAVGDRFGMVLSAQGGEVVVGSPRSNEAGSDSGSAYLFDLVQGEPQRRVLGAAGGWELGLGVATSGAVTVIGAPGAPGAPLASGRAEVYNAITGELINTLIPSNQAFFSSPDFGWSVDTDGEAIIVGAWNEGGVQPGAGAAYLYTVDAVGGVEYARLDADDADSSDGLGWDVAISGPLAIASARFDDEGGNNAGAAYVFESETGAQLAKLIALDPQSGSDYGWSVAIDGALAVVGAPRADGTQGAAYVYDLSDSENPVEIAKLSAPSPVPSDSFGDDVAVSGRLVLVGDSRARPTGLKAEGAAYLFEIPEGGPAVGLAPSATLAAPSPEPIDLFGFSVAMENQRALVGAFGAGEGGVGFLFDVADPGSPTLIAEFAPDPAVVGEDAGYSVDLAGQHLVLGAFRNEVNGTDAGAFYQFPVPMVVDVEPTPCAGDADGSGSVDLADLNLVLGNFGGPASGAPGADFDGSGTIDLPDLNAVLGAFGTDCP